MLPHEGANTPLDTVAVGSTSDLFLGHDDADEGRVCIPALAGAVMNNKPTAARART